MDKVHVIWTLIKMEIVTTLFQQPILGDTESP